MGHGDTIDHLVAVDVVGLGLGVSAIAAGSTHTCALTSGGGVKCWGANSAGQLGDNTQTSRSTPVDVQGLTSGVSAIATGGDHTCAVTTGGGLKCWGNNAFGQLGDGSKIQRLTPVDVFGLSSGVSKVAGSFGHTCALTTIGGVRCWGYNLYGQLGDNSNIDHVTPADVFGLTSGVSAIATGTFHACALTATGRVNCWGQNNFGQLGNDSTANSPVPVTVASAPGALARPLGSVVAISAQGGQHTCALIGGGGVKCWGHNNQLQLGLNNTGIDSLTPVDASGLTSGVSAIATGNETSCAVTSGGGVSCWGSNRFGQFGNNTTSSFGNPFLNDALTTPKDTIALNTVQSRKSHGASGSFDLRLDNAQTIAGLVTVEPRTIGSGHLVAFQFLTAITSPGAATAQDRNGAPISTGNPLMSGNEVLVSLLGIADNSRALVTLTGVNGTENVSVPIGFLVGDVNNTRSVNSSDISSVKARSGQTTTAANFLFDVNASGAVNSSDISAIKARSGLVLGP